MSFTAVFARFGQGLNWFYNDVGKALAKNVVAAGLAETLSNPDAQFTVYAPTNEAFAKLPKSALDHLLDPKNIKELDALLDGQRWACE